MQYDNFTTFKVRIEDAIAWVTFDYPQVNIQGLPMLADLDMLAQKLEADRNVKVVVFQSANPDIFVAHADTNFLKDMSGTAVSRDEVKLLDLQRVLERISRLPQATIAKIEGFARGGGHEFALACDMRFAARGKATFMQMEVAMGILPCGGGASRMARQVGLGRALEITLSARDWDADEAERVGIWTRQRLAPTSRNWPSVLHNGLPPPSTRPSKLSTSRSTSPLKTRSSRKPIGSTKRPAKHRH